MPQLLTRHKWLWIVAAAFVALFIFAACDDDDDEGETPADGETPVVSTGPLKIGVLVAFTGGLSDFGPALENAALLAELEINAAGGVLGQDIEIVTGDTATDPSQGVTEATRLVEIEGVQAILGALSSGVSLPIVESVTGPSNILQISPASTSVALSIAADNDFFFRTTISDAAQGPVLATVAEGEGFTNVCTMFVNNAYGQGLSEIFAENFEAMGFTVPAQVPHEEELLTYASELDTCTAEGPEAVAAIAYPESAGVFLREAVELGVADNYLFVDGTKSDAMFVELGWPAAFDGMRGTAPGFLPPSPPTETFEAAYEAEYGELPPLPFLREIYDGVYLIALAAEAAGSVDPTAMRDVLRDVAGPPGESVVGGTDGFTSALELIAAGTDINYAGAAGPVDFDDVGDILLGAIETWHVDTAAQELVTDESYRADLSVSPPEITLIE